MYCISPVCFGAMCIIVRENYYASYLKPGIILKLLNMISTAATSKCKYIIKGTTWPMLEL